MGKWMSWVAVLAAGVLLGLAAPGMAQAPVRDGSHDFDFNVGTWRSHLVRFVITPEGRDQARFVQSYSADGGATWEDNWIATDVRRLLTA